MSTFVTVAVLVVGALIAVLVVVAVKARAAERERVRRIEQWARENDWYVVQRPRVGWAARVPGGNRRGASLEVRGTSYGYPVSVFDYAYTTSSTTNGTTTTTTHHLVVAVVRVAARHPQVAVAPRGPFSRMGRALFGERPNAVGHAEFDRRFRVRTQHPELAKALLGPTLVAEHVAGTVPCWDLTDGELLTVERGRIGEPDRIPDHAVGAVRVAMLLGR